LKDAFIEDDEILEMAVAREVDAIKFYTVLAESARDSNMRRMFEELAAEEMEHKAKLELEIMKIGRVVDTQRPLIGFKYDDQQDNISPAIDVDYKGILSMGIQKEDASFRLYMDLAGMINDPHSRDTLVALAQEEAEHKLRFQTELERVVESE
jgi:rubrerythrin